MDLHLPFELTETQLQKISELNPPAPVAGFTATSSINIWLSEDQWLKCLTTFFQNQTEEEVVRVYHSHQWRITKDCQNKIIETGPVEKQRPHFKMT